MVEVLQIETPALGDRSYLVHDGEAALVVDPQRDIDRVIALAADVGVRVTHVAETHVHNDYVTGGLALARAAGAATWSTRTTRSPSTAPRSATATAWRSAAGCGSGCWRPPATPTAIWPTWWRPVTAGPGAR